ncbi:hypothetical protein [Candidatus Uabimicrobium amorphum]|uniref:Uncharacterized protein n=1 Tax=Uabimicrobium amorphum TaxID=2596890 RepID=A0A5S9IUM8_UABAM|nr:hypothetical protein [Candidatus Uabimicrobium amorphum]BBM87896.1 hypothetical protein UABAM_06311 [Candidatus Uabimicrobium amorphum]
MDDILKGNYKVKKSINEAETKDPSLDVKEEFKNKALASLGGSMVYVERDKLNWDGDDE